MIPQTNDIIELSIYADYLEDQGRYIEALYLREELLEMPDGSQEDEYPGMTLYCDPERPPTNKIGGFLTHEVGFIFMLEWTMVGGDFSGYDVVGI